MTASPALPFLPFALPDIGDEEIAEVVDTLKSGWVTTGPKAKRFEADFAAFLGDESLHCIAVNSATAGLHLALEAIGIGPGDEVITTTHTFTATAEVVRYLGADVKLVDIDPATLNIDPAAIEAAITPRTKAILPVHYAGLAADMPAILAIAARHGLKVVEDAAHALPTTMRRPAGRHAGQRRHGVQLLRQQDHHHRRGRHARHARRRTGRARQGDAPARHEPRRLRPLHRHGAELVLRDRRARLQVQPDRHRRRARPAPAEEGARASSSAAPRSRRCTTRRWPACR